VSVYPPYGVRPFAKSDPLDFSRGMLRTGPTTISVDDAGTLRKGDTFTIQRWRPWWWKALLWLERKADEAELVWPFRTFEDPVYRVHSAQAEAISFK
jgi:hypothetical protein